LRGRLPITGTAEEGSFVAGIWLDDARADEIGHLLRRLGSETVFQLEHIAGIVEGCHWRRPSAKKRQVCAIPSTTSNHVLDEAPSE
jgi:hypothetical protein